MSPSSPAGWRSPRCRWPGCRRSTSRSVYLVFHWIVLATSWNLLSGYAGYFSFGHGAFFGVGLYTTATLAGRFDWPFLATLPVAAIVPAASASRSAPSCSASSACAASCSRC